jgi:SAM-dependent methyltransferase
VTGLDVTPHFLELARRDAAERGVEVDYVEGDMRSLPWSERFDAIVNWFTSFGYFEDNDNRRVLAEAHRALKKGGRLLIENNHLPWILMNFRSEGVSERDGNFMIDRSQYDVPSGRVTTERIVVRGGRTRRLRFFVRMFTFAELRDWLVRAGFEAVEGYGRGGERLALEHPRMLTVARK